MEVIGKNGCKFFRLHHQHGFAGFGRLAAFRGKELGVQACGEIGFDHADDGILAHHLTDLQRKLFAKDRVGRGFIAFHIEVICIDIATVACVAVVLELIVDVLGDHDLVLCARHSARQRKAVFLQILFTHRNKAAEGAVIGLMRGLVSIKEVTVKGNPAAV